MIFSFNKQKGRTMEWYSKKMTKLWRVTVFIDYLMVMCRRDSGTMAKGMDEEAIRAVMVTFIKENLKMTSGKVSVFKYGVRVVISISDISKMINIMDSVNRYTTMVIHIRDFIRMRLNRIKVNFVGQMAVATLVISKTIWSMVTELKLSQMVTCI